MDRRVAWAAAALLTACSGNSTPPTLLQPPPGGVAALPKWLSYTCVQPGCDTVLTTEISVLGARNVAIKRIVLSERDRDDFVVVASQEPPFILKYTETFTIDVTYAPLGDPRLGDLSIEVTYTDASATEDSERIEAGTLEIPLVRRLVGEPRLAVEPEELVFGPVLPTARKMLPLTIRNVGFGNVGLVIDQIESSHPAEVRVERLPPAAIIPGESWDVQVIYEPLQEDFLEGALTIRPVAPSVVPTIVPFLGTSISTARVAVVPDDAVDFGEVPVGQSAAALLKITNRGAEELLLRDVQITGSVPGATLEVVLPNQVRTATVAPLETLEAMLVLDTTIAGEISTNVRVTSNDRMRPVVDVPVIGTITQPEISVSPTQVDFGTVPRGWTLVRSVEVSNSGYGDLVITNASLIFGSSELFIMRTVPSLPITLRHGQRVGIEIEFRSEAEASFSGILALDSNDADTPFIEVPLGAQGASCELGCPIQNGTPTCLGGLCAIASCDADWYDADRDAATGCECREIMRDPAEFCQGSHYAGSLSDTNGDRATFTGILPTESDVDVIRFHARDQTNFFSDDFDVRVSLESTDPGIQFCIYRHDTADHLSECFFENENCPTNRSYRRDGSLGREDGADFVVRVFRTPGSNPTCTSYTLFMRNG